MMLDPIVDYISISVPIPMLLSNFALHINEGTPFEVDRRTKRLVNFLSIDHTAKWSKKGGRFNRMLHSDKFGFTYMDGENSSVSLIQISGVGCAYLREKGYIDNVIRDWAERFTRFDIAVDIETDTQPEPFARSRRSQRFENGGHERSITGETWYVGRRTSDRHARVYRYYEPHPRSRYLRVEYELHDDAAKHAGGLYPELGVSALAYRLGDTFGWNHECYVPPSDQEKMPSAPRRDSFGKTEFWIHRAVKPALEKMVTSGKLQFLIDFHAWLGAIIDEAYITQEEYSNDVAQTNRTTALENLAAQSLQADSRISSLLGDNSVGN